MKFHVTSHLCPDGFRLVFDDIRGRRRQGAACLTKFKRKTIAGTGLTGTRTVEAGRCEISLGDILARYAIDMQAAHVPAKLRW